MPRSNVLVVVLAFVLGLPAGAGAQDTAPVVGNFGGGAVVGPPASPFSAGNMVIGLRAGGDATVRITATIAAACASGTVDAVAPVAADGTFSVSGAARQANVHTNYVLTGTLTATPSGTATAHFKRTVDGRTRRCSARDVQWQARRPLGGFGDAPAVAPQATLLGTTGQREGGVRRGIVLRVADDGHAIERAVYGVTLRCTGDVRSPTFDFPRDAVAIDAAGQLGDRESGTRRAKTTITRYVERFGGTVGSAGGEGFFSVKLTIRRRSTGRRITACRSGEVRWAVTV